MTRILAREGRLVAREGRLLTTRDGAACCCGSSPPQPFVRCLPCDSAEPGLWYIPRSALNGQPCVMAVSGVRCFTCGSQYGGSEGLPQNAVIPVVSPSLRDCCDCEQLCQAVDPGSSPQLRAVEYSTEGWFLGGFIGPLYPRCCLPNPICYRWGVEGESVAVWCGFEADGVQYGPTTVRRTWSIEQPDSCNQGGSVTRPLVETWTASGGYVAAGGNATFSRTTAQPTGSTGISSVPDRFVFGLRPTIGRRGIQFFDCDPNNLDGRAGVLTVTRRVHDCVSAEVEYRSDAGDASTFMPGPASLAGLQSIVFGSLRVSGGSSRERKWARILHQPGAHRCGGSCSSLGIGANDPGGLL